MDSIRLNRDKWRTHQKSVNFVSQKNNQEPIGNSEGDGENYSSVDRRFSDDCSLNTLHTWAFKFTCSSLCVKNITNGAI